MARKKPKILNKDDRYQVLTESESGHCCFEATVLDTAYDESNYKYIVCECFQVEQAILVATALNKGVTDNG